MAVLRFWIATILSSIVREIYQGGKAFRIDQGSVFHGHTYEEMSDIDWFVLAYPMNL